MYCKNCGSVLDENALLCVKCGTTNGLGENYCSHCGSNVTPGQIACTNCGYAIKNQKIVKKRKTTIVVISIILGIIIFISIIAKNCGNSVDFNKIYDDYCNYSWAELGSDNSYLSIDTNPYDYDDKPLYYSEAYYAIEKINSHLGLPNSLFKDMGSTSALNGKQTRTYSDKNLMVTWSYHPDQGLEVTYSKIK